MIAQNLWKRTTRYLGIPARILLVLFILVSALPLQPPPVSADAAPSTRFMCENDPSLVGCWRMEEGSGSTLHDGGAAPFNDASTVASPSFGDGKIGDHAISLNGTSQYATTVNEASLNITGSITLAAWVYTTKTGTQYIVKKAANGDTDGYELSLATTGYAFVRFNQKTSANTYRVDATGINSYPLNTWFHLAATYDGTTTILYINGTEVSRGAGPASITTNSLPISLGSESTVVSPLSGRIDDARVYSRALSATEIIALADLTPPGDATAPGAPIGLTAVPGNGSASLSWTYPADPDVAGYNVYRSETSPVDTTTPINGAIVTTEAYNDSGLTNGTPYYYTVLAVDTSGNVSDPADEASATPENTTTCYALTLTSGANGGDPTAVPLKSAACASNGEYVASEVIALTAAPDSGYQVASWTGTDNDSLKTNTNQLTMPADVRTVTVNYEAIAVPSTGLQFNGSNQYVKFPNGNSLAYPVYTIETWFKRTGAGVGVTTGGSGIPLAIPLVTKGTSESETALVDINYFLGIDASSAKLVADFEEGAGGTSPSLNHPLTGSTVILNGVWYHAAMTYDGTTLKLFLNGTEEGAITVGQPTASGTNSPTAFATSIRSNGTTIQGYFAGVLDEVRIWSSARTQTQIRDTINQEITSGTNLEARWGINEGTGSSVSSSVGTYLGTLTNGPTWVVGAPFDIVIPSDTCYALTRTSGANGGVPTANPVKSAACATNGEYVAGEVIALTAAPDSGYQVASWTGTDNDTLKTNTNLLTMPTGIRTVNVTYEVAPTTTYGLQFDGTNDYVTFGAAPGLGVTSFTLEAWVKRAAGGIVMSTGSLGFDNSGGRPNIYPVVTKGMGEGETPANVNMNYFLGITSTGFVGADFEDKAGGVNHPIWGSTAVGTGTWHHIAATYSGTCWVVYLDGNVETMNGTACPNATPESISIQHAGLGAALNSTGGLGAGYFSGIIDEARVWNRALSQSEIRSTINQEITSGTGLLARWGLNEGSGTTIASSVGSFPGTLTNGPTWVTPGAPFNIIFDTTPPAAPTLLTAVGANMMVTLDWADNSELDLAGYNIYRGTVSGVYTKQNTSLILPSTHIDTGLTNGQEYFYTVTAVDTTGNEFGYSNEGYAIPNTDLGSALEFTTNTSTYVTFGDPAKLDLATFTIETWFKRTGAGTPNTTGTNGILNALPLVTHGAPQAEGSNVDANWMLLINDATDVIAADFEDMATGLNHPLSGVTTISNNVWHHAATTFDGTTLKIYLDGKLENSLVTGAVPRSDTIQSAALGTMITSTDATNGFFQGVLDEARVWNRALTQTELLATINEQVTSGSGLVARWGLNDGAGTTVSDSIVPAINGTITGANYAWVPGAPFNLNLAPSTPTLVAPSDLATGVSTSPTLTVNVSDPINAALTVSFYGRAKNGFTGEDFTLIAIPDPQYYASTYPNIYNAQMNWVVGEKTTSNIKYVMSLGDNVDNSTTYPGQFTNAMTAWDILTTGGIPYGLTLGNHDGAPSPTTNFNTAFGTRISTQPTYGGRYGTTDYDNTYATFSASGMDFIVFYIEYDGSMTSSTHAIISWANGIMAANSDKRAIVVTHNLLNGNSFSTQGSALYEGLKENSNLFMMLGGHLDETGQRTDVYNGHTVYSLRSDYQSLDSQQSGYLRIMRFSPADNMIHITTYSPNQDKFRTINNNVLDLPYTMGGVSAFELIGSTSVASGSNASIVWPGLLNNEDYEWYAASSNGANTTISPSWSFSTEAASNNAPVITETDPVGVTMSEDGAPLPFGLTLHATDVDVTDILTWSISTPASHGSASASGTGISKAIGYTPEVNYNGSDNFIVMVSDGNGGTDTINVNVTINAVNDAPVCVGVPLLTAEDTTGEVAPSCTDVDLGDILSYSIVGAATNGTASVAAGMLRYEPSLNYNGSDSFTYKANDTHVDSNTVSVAVTVSAVNDPPVVTNPGAKNNAEGAVISLQVSASDVDGPSLTYSATNLPLGLSINPTTGLISGTLTYRAAFPSPYSTSVTVTDGSTPVTENFIWTITNASSGLCGSDPNLVGCWQMEEGSGSFLIDATANGNDANITGSPTWVSGKDGQALDLSGTGQYAVAPDSNSLDATNAITLAAWVKPEKVATQNILKKTMGTTTTNGYELSLSSANKVFIRFNGSTTYRVDSLTSYPTDGNTWMHVAATYDGTIIKVYINGVLDSSANPATTTIGVNSTNLGIGAQSDGTALYQGLLDDARIYNRALSLAEIESLAGVATSFNLSVNKVGSGTVISDPAGISCGADCSEIYALNTVVTLTAASDTISTFTGWSGSGCSGTGTCVVTMNAAKTVTATFTQNVHSITLLTGWNLVSFNLHPADTAVTAVLSSIDGSYDLVYAWDAGLASNNWQRADNNPVSPDTLTVLDETRGFWIHMTAPATLNVYGSKPASTDIDVSTVGGGWNLVGYPAAANSALPGALVDHGIGTDFSLIYANHANDAADPWKMYDRTGPAFANDLPALAPGWGYWIKVSAVNSWDVPYLP